MLISAYDSVFITLMMDIGLQIKKFRCNGLSGKRYQSDHQIKVIGKNCGESRNLTWFRHLMRRLLIGRFL